MATTSLDGSAPRTDALVSDAAEDNAAAEARYAAEMAGSVGRTSHRTVADRNLGQALTIGAGDTLDVHTGQTVEGATVLGGGTIEVQTGGNAAGTVIDKGGVEIVRSGGTAGGAP